SSRRRHTRSDRDWSSDVCSSDLTVDSELAQSYETVAEENEQELWSKRLNGREISRLLARAEASVGADDEIRASFSAFRKTAAARSEERRVGKECRCRRWRHHRKK